MSFSYVKYLLHAQNSQCKSPLIDKNSTFVYGGGKEMQKMNLGSQIKKYRNELSMSQDELAEKVFVSRQSISNWENEGSLS